MQYPIVQLAKDQERRLKAGHLWIYSNEIHVTKTPLSNFSPGDLVVVVSQRGETLGLATINPHTLLCARILTADPATCIDEAFFCRRLQKALERRERIYSAPFYRWVYAESDYLPGLIIDRFDEIVVVQANTVGMDRCLPKILAAIETILRPKTILCRNDSPYRTLEGLSCTETVIHGDPCTTLLVRENNCLFEASALEGQKTSWFYDHRDNRTRLAYFVAGKTALDVFSYLGAFGITLAQAGATAVTCVDSSQRAIEQLQKNIKRNHCENTVRTITGDAFEVLAELSNKKLGFDVIVVDPPAFIKKKKDLLLGTQAYEKINTLALALLNPQGIFLTASCSMHYSAEALLNSLRKASLLCKKPLTILEQLHQGRDHPVHPAIAETNYLKGFIAMRVDSM